MNLKCTVSVCCLSVALAGTASAQIDSIVVTAEKKEGDLQKTPIAISAYDQKLIDDFAIRDIRDLTRLVPTLELAPVATGAVYFSLRGVGNESPLAGGDNGVAPHIDGVYIARPAATLINLYDVERVEVLRGPQGTLYGRNATGGVINIISNKPGDEFEANVDATFGNYELARFRGAINIPLSDNIAARVAGVITRRDGYQFNEFIGQRQGDDDDSEYIKGSLSVDFSDNFNGFISAVYSHIGGAGPQPVLGNEVLPIAPVAFVPAGPGFAPILFDPNSVASNPSVDDPRVVNYDDTALTNFDVFGLTGTFTFESDFATVKSITGYYDNKIAPTTCFDCYAADIPDPADPSLAPFTFFIPPPPGVMAPPTPITDGAAFPFLIGRSTGLGISFRNDSRQISQEITIAGSSGPLEWIAGGYFFQEDVDFVLEGDALPHLFFTPLNPTFAGLPDFGLFNSADFKATSYAAFGNLTFAVTDSLTLRGGARYNYDKKEADLIQHTPASGIFLVADSPEESWDAITGSAGFDWTPHPDHLIYASASRGYKAGAINLVSAFDNIVDPETIWSYEVGTKSEFFDNRLRLNTAFFYSDYKNLQVNFFEPTGVVLRNADSAIVKGVELDLNAAPTDWLTVSGAFAYTDAEYDEFVTNNPFTGQTGVDLSGNRLNQTPEIAFNVGANVTIPLNASDYDLVFHVDHTYKDEIDYQAFNTALTRADDFHITNLRLSLRKPQSEGFSIELFVNNVQDTDAISSIQLPPTLAPGNSANPSTAIHYRPPRTFGVMVGYSF